MLNWFGASKPPPNDEARMDAISRLAAQRDAKLAELRALVQGQVLLGASKDQKAASNGGPMKLKAAKSEKVAQAWALCDELQRHVRSLDAEVTAMRQDLLSTDGKKQEEQVRGERDALRKEVESLSQKVAAQALEMRAQVDAIRAGRETVERLEAEIKVAEALRNASITITASVDPFEKEDLRDQVMELQEELEAVRTNSYRDPNSSSSPPRPSAWEHASAEPSPPALSPRTDADSEGDVAEAVEELQAHLQALLKERDLMRDDAMENEQQLAGFRAELEATRTALEAERQKSVRGEAFEVELLATRQEAARAIELQEAARKELAISERKAELLSSRLIDFCTRIDDDPVSPTSSMGRSSHFLSPGQASSPEKSTLGASVERAAGGGQEALQGARVAAATLENTRVKVGSLKAKWELMRQEANQGQIRATEAAQKLSALQAEKETLAKEVSVLKLNERKRRTSVVQIASKLDSAETSWNPWKEINDCRTLAASLQQSASAASLPPGSPRGDPGPASVLHGR